MSDAELETLLLRDHQSTTGELVTWRPSPKMLEAVTNASDDARPPSYMQEAHLRLQTAMAAEGRSEATWIGMSFELPTTLSADDIGQIFSRWTRRHPVLRGWFEQSDSEYGWKRVPAEALEFVPVTRGSASTVEEVREFVMSELTASCTPFQAPGYLLCGVFGPDKTVLFFGQDHIYTDGVSAIVTISELLQLFEAQHTGTAAPEWIAVGDYLDYAEKERADADTVTVEDARLQSWIDFATTGMGEEIPKFPVETGIVPGELAPYKAEIFHLLTPDEDAKIDRIAELYGATFPAMLFAALGLAARDLGGQSVYRILNPVHTRTEEQWWSALGWFINLVPVACELSSDDDLVTLAPKMRKAFSSGRKASSIPAMRAFEIFRDVFGIDLDTTKRPPIVSYIDGRLFPAQDLWAAYHPALLSGAGDGDEINVWVNRWTTGTSAASVLPDMPHVIEAVGAYFACARDHLLHAIAQHEEQLAASVQAAAIAPESTT